MLRKRYKNLPETMKRAAAISAAQIASAEARYSEEVRSGRWVIKLLQVEGATVWPSVQIRRCIRPSCRCWR